MDMCKNKRKYRTCLECGKEFSRSGHMTWCEDCDTPYFIRRANQVHKNKYNYSETEYINQATKVRIGCKKHGMFLQVPKDHLAGCGCPECGGNQKQTTIEFVKRAIKVHGKKYDYSLSSYSRLKDELKIICPIHGIFRQVAKFHLKGSNCPKCAIETRLQKLEEYRSRGKK